MKFCDRLLRKWRIAKASPYVAEGARVLDIGCDGGALLKSLKPRISEGMGIDPRLKKSLDLGFCRLIAGRFPQDLPDCGSFDVVALLATIEHIPPGDIQKFAEDCAGFLKTGGYLVITVPSPAADTVLRFLKALRLLDGTCLEQHYGLTPERVPLIFSAGGLTLVKANKFQLGFNNLFVFRKPFE